MNVEKRLELQSMPDDLMKLAKDQFGPHFLQFEIWVASVIDAAYNVGKANGSHDVVEPLRDALRESTAIGISCLFAYVGAYESLSPHKRKQWDRLAELARLADGSTNSARED